MKKNQNDKKRQELLFMISDCEQKQKEILEIDIEELHNFITTFDGKNRAAKAVIASVLCIYSCLNALDSKKEGKEQNG